MCLAAYIILFLFGLFPVIGGKLVIVQGMTLKGAKARIFGVFLLLPLTLSLAIKLLIPGADHSVLGTFTVIGLFVAGFYISSELSAYNKSTFRKMTKDESEHHMNTNVCPVCGDFPGRNRTRVIEYSCPYCGSPRSVEESDFKHGKGAYAICQNCRKSVLMPDKIWCPQCHNGLVDLDKILEYISKENGVEIEKLKQENKSRPPSPEEMREYTDMINNHLKNRLR